MDTAREPSAPTTTQVPEPGAGVPELGTTEQVDNLNLSSPRYLAWKKNASSLYNLLVTATLPWPSLTVEWFPSIEDFPDETVQNVLLGTRTLGQMPEYLRIGHLVLPKTKFTSLDKYDVEQGTIGEYSPQNKSAGFDIIQRIDFQGEVNKARYMPSNPNMIASISSTGQTCVFDTTHYPLNPIGVVKPDIELPGHTTEGFGLAWSPMMPGFLATGANDSKIFIWDITKYDSSKGTLSPTQRLDVHMSPVNDLAWHPSESHLLGSVGDDKSFIISDWRSPKVVTRVDTGQHAALSVDFNPTNIHLAALGLENGDVQLWDTRHTATPLHSLKGHSESCVAVRWNPNSPALLASGSQDATVLIWDAGLITEQKELRFRHAGHNGPVSDVAWNLTRPAALASVAEDNSLHFWEPALGVLERP